MEWAIFGASFVVVIIALAILAEHLRLKRKAGAQELAQQARLAALEKGVPLPEWDGGMLDDAARDPSDPAIQARRLAWFRLMALCTGLILTFSGLGMGLAFHFSGEVDMREMATLGLIPLMTGLGLLVFYGLTRNRAE